MMDVQGEQLCVCVLSAKLETKAAWIPPLKSIHLNSGVFTISQTATTTLHFAILLVTYLPHGQNLASFLIQIESPQNIAMSVSVELMNRSF